MSDGDLPLERARQMDATLAAGLTHAQLDALAAARRAWHDRQTAGGTWPIAVGVDDDSGDPPDVAGRRLLAQALRHPGAPLFDELFVRAMRSELNVRPGHYGPPS